MIFITLAQYFGVKIEHPDATPERRANADAYLLKLNDFLTHAQEQGHYDGPIDPDTGTRISGSRHGAGDGGFRLSGSITGRPLSGHKEGRAADPFDPGDKLDNWITTFDEDGGIRNELLERFGLYREHPSATPGWAHLTDRAPASGRRTYWP